MTTNCSSSSSRTNGILARTLDMLLVVFLLLLVKPSVCNPGCKADADFTETKLYALHVEKEYSSITVRVYYTACAGLESVGPSWYQLEVLGSAKSLGSFDAPVRRSGAILVDDRIEFTAGEEPLVLLDFPRSYKWSAPNHQQVPSSTCFRLTIQHSTGVCEQITTNCTKSDLEDDVEDMEGSADEGTLTESQDPLPEIEVELETQCHIKYNCSEARYRLTCGSNGKWYTSTCALRLDKCLSNNAFQRDVTKISCNSPTSAPTPPPSQPCFDYLENFKSLAEYLPPGYTLSKCDSNGQFRPIQCKLQDGTIVCECYSERGEVYGNTDWIVDCSSETALPPPSRCGI